MYNVLYTILVLKIVRCKLHAVKALYIHFDMPHMEHIKFCGHYVCPLILAPADFSDILEVIPLSLECQNITIPVSIVDDLALENTEDFSVNITSTDEFVAIGQDTTQVFIVDNGEVELIQVTLEHDHN